MARMLPIGDATELPIEIPDTSQLDRGLRGPQLQPEPLGAQGPKVSGYQAGPQRPAGYTPPVEAQGLRAPATPVADALATEARAAGPLTRAATNVGRVVGKVAPVVGAAAPLAAGADVVSHFNDYKINDPEVDSSARGTIRALGSGDFAGAGRSLSKGLLETGMDLGSAAANTADLVVPGKAPVSTRYNQMLRDSFGDQLVDKSGTPPPVQTALPVAPAAGGGAPPVATGIGNIMPPQPSGLVPTDSGLGGAPYSRVGNAFSDGSANRSKSGFGVSTVGNDPAAIQRGVDSDREMLGLRVAAAQANDAPPGITGFRDSATEERNARIGRDNPLARLESTARLAGTSRERAAAANSYAQLAASQDQNASQESIAAARERGATARAGVQNDQGLRIAAMNNATSRLNNDQTTASSRYSADQGLRGKRESNELDVRKTLLEQSNKDRQFGLDNYKLGEDLDGKATDRRAKAVEALHAEISSMLPPTADNKPDLATAARYAQGLNAAVADRQRALQAEVQRNPGNAAARSELEGLAKQGLGALDEVAKRKLIAGMKAKDLADANHSGFNPFGGTSVQSDAPIAGLRRKSGLISDDYEALDASGRPTGAVIPARAVDNPGSTLGLGGRRDNTFDILKQR